MSVFSVTHTDENPIPRPVGKARTKWCIVSLPQNLVVREGEASRSISIDLDPGRYRLVVSQMAITGEGRATLMKWRKDFYHDCTPEQHTALVNSPLRFTKGMMATDGTSFNCQLPGCSNEATSRMAAVLHEAEHSGVDLLAQPKTHPGDIPPPKIDAAVVDAQRSADKQTAVGRLRNAALSQE